MKKCLRFQIMKNLILVFNKNAIACTLLYWVFIVIYSYIDGGLRNYMIFSMMMGVIIHVLPNVVFQLLLFALKINKSVYINVINSMAMFVAYLFVYIYVAQIIKIFRDFIWANDLAVFICVYLILLISILFWGFFKRKILGQFSDFQTIKKKWKN